MTEDTQREGTNKSVRAAFVRIETNASSLSMYIHEFTTKYGLNVLKGQGMDAEAAKLLAIIYDCNACLRKAIEESRHLIANDSPQG